MPLIELGRLYQVAEGEPAWRVWLAVESCRLVRVDPEGPGRPLVFAAPCLSGDPPSLHVQEQHGPPEPLWDASTLTVMDLCDFWAVDEAWLDEHISAVWFAPGGTAKKSGPRLGKARQEGWCKFCVLVNRQDPLCGFCGAGRGELEELGLWQQTAKGEMEGVEWEVWEEVKEG